MSNFFQMRKNPPFLQGENVQDCHKVLGMLWKNQSDKLALEFLEIIAKAENERVLTKRVLLRTATSFYDPLHS